MPYHILHILLETRKNSVGPKFQQLITATMRLKQYSRRITVELTINKRNIPHIARENSHLLLIGNKCGTLSMKDTRKKKRIKNNADTH